MSELTNEELRRENAELSERLRELRRLADSALGAGVAASFGAAGAIPRVIEALPTTEIGPILRELSLRCVRLSRESAEPPTARVLEEIGIDLAQRATRIEAIVNNPGSAT